MLAYCRPLARHFSQRATRPSACLWRYSSFTSIRSSRSSSTAMRRLCFHPVTIVDCVLPSRSIRRGCHAEHCTSGQAIRLAPYLLTAERRAQPGGPPAQLLPQQSGADRADPERAQRPSNRGSRARQGARRRSDGGRSGSKGGLPDRRLAGERGQCASSPMTRRCPARQCATRQWETAGKPTARPRARTDGAPAIATGSTEEPG